MYRRGGPATSWTRSWSARRWWPRSAPTGPSTGAESSGTRSGSAAAPGRHGRGRTAVRAGSGCGGRLTDDSRRLQRGPLRPGGGPRDQHGDLAVPVNHIDAQGYNLGDFIAYQRALVAGSARDPSGRPRTLDPERRAALDELGMIWAATAPKRPPTQEEIAALRAFPHQRGKPFAEALLALVEAGVEQRALAKADVNTGTLSLRLKGARTNAYTDDRFPQHLDAARAFHERHGHLRPLETSDDPEARSLAGWLSKQRRSRRSRQLSDQQIAALDELAMDWEPLGSRWQQALQADRTYHQEHGHLRPPNGTTVTGVDLSVWLSRQRTAHQRGTLQPDRVAALDELGIDWTPSRGVADVRIAQAWQTRLNDARQYQAAHGHL